MEIRMLNTEIILNVFPSRLSCTCEQGKIHKHYYAKFIINADAILTLHQIDCMMKSFCDLATFAFNQNETDYDYYDYMQKIKNINKLIREYKIIFDKTKGFIVRMDLREEICFDEFMCKTDDFENFTWYARKINDKEEIEDFKPIK